MFRPISIVSSPKRPALSLLLLLFALPSPAGEISFAPVVTYAVHSPTQVAIADVNGDGLPDIISNDNSLGIGRVVVLLNEGGGAFGAPFGVGSPDSAVFGVGDLDNDGDIDIVTSSTPRNYWYENDGSGNFTEHRFRQSSFRAVAIAVCDYDSDSDLDLGLVTPLGDLEIATNLGGAEFGHFTGRHLFDTDCCNYPTSIAAVDIRGDGRPQFVVASHSERSFTLVDWVGGRDFRLETMSHIGRPDNVAYGRLNSGSNLDAIFTHNAITPSGPGRGLWIACNDGTGELVICDRLRQTIEAQSPEAVAIADFDNDGRNEFVVSNTSFAQTVIVAAQADDGTWSAATEVQCGGGAIAIAVGDLNMDGLTDIVVANYSESIGVLLNTSH